MIDDAQVRLAAFRFLEEQRGLAADEGVLPRKVLVQGFVYEGQRVPLLGPQGIFKRRVPLIYFHGIVPGLYVAEWPVYIVNDDPGRLTFTVSVDDRRFASLGSVDSPDFGETEIRRRYATRLFQQRLHQREFRERVVRAYQHHCAVCRLRRDELLDAAHIVPDADPHGMPSVRNGVALCTLHHAAFDRHVIGITPDYIVQVRRDVLDQEDGPMLIHGLQGFHGQRLRLPHREAWLPDRQLLEERYGRFRLAVG